MKAFQAVLYCTLLAMVTVIPACGGGGSSTVAGIGGTGKIASGSITRFGSIFVNGIEYDIDTASCSVDDSDVTGNCQANLSIGMVVTVQGTVSGALGTASSVVFAANVEGPVAALTTQPDGLTRRFSVLGVEVTVDKATTLFDGSVPGFSFDTLADANVVKISGFLDATGALQATYIRKISDTVTPGVSPAIVKGTATNVTGGGVSGGTFTLNGVTVSILTGADLTAMPGSAVGNGDAVAVYGVVTGAASVDAARIEPDSPASGDDGDEVSVEGLVSGFSGDPGNFMVDGYRIDASSAQLQPASLQLVNGLRVEAEGVINGGILVARELEGRGGEIKIDATVSLRASNTLTVSLGDGSLSVSVDNQTRIEDSTGSLENPLLSDINPGDFVQIRGFQANGGITATEIHRENSDKVVLQGPVDSFSAGTSITILGITFFTDGNTEFEDNNDNDLGSAGFYAALAPGDLVKIEDEKPADGTADEVDQED